MKTQPFLIQAISPLHAGTGQAADIVDQPIARMRATGIPFVPGSSIKGVLRDARSTGAGSLDDRMLAAVFGPDSVRSDDAAHAGAVSIGDARLLLLPVRSFLGTFAFATSPLLLELARRDLGWNLPVPRPESQHALVPASGSVLLDVKRRKVYMQDLDLQANEDPGVAAWADRLATYVAEPTLQRAFLSRFLVIDDDTMAFLWETGTQLDARVRIDDDTRTAAEGALWLEESLPPETILVGVATADRSRLDAVAADGAAMLAKVLCDKPEIIQLGGKATIGRGLCRIVGVDDGGRR
jgi:CRISPR-associated protein Cmr4